MKRDAIVMLAMLPTSKRDMAGGGEGPEENDSGLGSHSSLHMSIFTLPAEIFRHEILQRLNNLEIHAFRCSCKQFSQLVPFVDGTPGNTSQLCEFAMAANSIDFVQWTRSIGCEWNIRKLFLGAIRSGKVEMLEWVFNQRMFERAIDTHDVLWIHKAVEIGNISSAQWLHDNGFETGTVLPYAVAALHNQMDMLEWLHLNHPDPVNPEVARWHKFPEWHKPCPSVNALEWLKLHTIELQFGLASEIVRTGPLDCIEWLWVNNQLSYTSGGDFIENPNPVIFEWAVANGFPMGYVTPRLVKKGDIELLDSMSTKIPLAPDAWHFAAQLGNFDMVKWFFARFPNNIYPIHIIPELAVKGNLPILKWLMEKGATLEPGICAFAASNNDREIIEWALENGASLDDKIQCPFAYKDCSGPYNPCEMAASGGHLEMLKWLRQQGCGWGEQTCTMAAARGHLEVLKWTRSNGCPWNDLVTTIAARMGQFVVLKWAVENGCPMDDSIMEHAADSGRIDVWEWLEGKCGKSE